MIPIFAFQSICWAVGLLHLLFPRLFSNLAPAVPAGGKIALGVYRRGRNLVQDVFMWGAIALTIWTVSTALAIHWQSWTWTCFAFVSLGLSVLTLSILMSMAKSAVTAGTAHIFRTASRWSNAIPLNTVPFALQTYKFWRLLGSPFYGLYLLLVLPFKAVLEIVKSVAAFGPTLSGWMQTVLEVLAAISVVAWTMVTLVMIQMQHGVVIMTLPMMGACLVIIALLVSLIYLGFAPKIKVKEFIAFLGYSGILLSVVFILCVLMPQMTGELARTLSGWHTQFIANIKADVWMRFVVGLVLLNGLFRFVVWIRPAAPYVTAAYVLLALWGTDIAFVKESVPVKAQKGTSALVCHNCILPDGTVDETLVDRPFSLAQDQWYIPNVKTAPKPVECRRAQYLVARFAVDNNPQNGFGPELYLVSWSGLPHSKTAGLNGFSRDWTDYAQFLATIGALLVAAILALFARHRESDPQQAQVPAPAPATGGGHGH